MLKAQLEVYNFFKFFARHYSADSKVFTNFALNQGGETGVTLTDADSSRTKTWNPARSLIDLIIPIETTPGPLRKYKMGQPVTIPTIPTPFKNEFVEMLLLSKQSLQCQILSKLNFHDFSNSFEGSNENDTRCTRTYSKLRRITLADPSSEISIFLHLHASNISSAIPTRKNMDFLRVCNVELLAPVSKRSLTVRNTHVIFFHFASLQSSFMDLWPIANTLQVTAKTVIFLYCRFFINPLTVSVMIASRKIATYEKKNIKKNKHLYRFIRDIFKYSMFKSYRFISSKVIYASKKEIIFCSVNSLKT